MTLSEKVAGWDQIYRDSQNYHFYDLHQPHRDLEKVALNFKDGEVRSILDLGCGIGRNLIPLQRMGFEMTGIDQSPTAISKLNQQLEEEGLPGKLVVGNFQKLPFANESFDGLISIQVLNHGTRPEIINGISEIERVLKTSGHIFVTVPGRVAQGKVRYSLVKTAEQISDRVYVPTTGKEIGIPHFIFNRSLARKLFSKFRLSPIWQDDKDYYCFTGVKK